MAKERTRPRQMYCTLGVSKCCIIQLHFTHARIIHTTATMPQSWQNFKTLWAWMPPERPVEEPKESKKRDLKYQMPYCLMCYCLTDAIQNENQRTYPFNMTGPRETLKVGNTKQIQVKIPWEMKERQHWGESQWKNYKRVTYKGDFRMAGNLETIWKNSFLHWCCCCLAAKSCLTLQPHGPQHARLPCPSPSPRVCSNSYPHNRH